VAGSGGQVGGGGGGEGVNSHADRAASLARQEAYVKVMQEALAAGGRVWWSAMDLKAFVAAPTDIIAGDCQRMHKRGVLDTCAQKRMRQDLMGPRKRKTRVYKLVVSEEKHGQKA
jgi:cytochrome c2